jgi:hypothetical protein
MTMKCLRPWLLLLLAVLLPLRGAVAASMACALPAPGVAMAMAMAATLADAEHAHHHHAAEPHDPAPQHPATADKCNLCAAAGAATPLPMRSPELQQPITGTAQRFPPLAVTVAGVVPDGPERPPRGG